MASRLRVARVLTLFVALFSPAAASAANAVSMYPTATTPRGGPHSALPYNGGPVMHGAVDVYFVLYGDWQNPNFIADYAAAADFVDSAGNSSYYAINTVYFDSQGPATTNIHLARLQSEDYSFGNNLASSDIASLVSRLVSDGGLPPDSNAIYVVVTSADVNVEGFCTQGCGWHNYVDVGGTRAHYVFVGDPAACPTACEAPMAGPSGNDAADAMASVMAHEIEESLTDPDLNAWHTREANPQENADLCAWQFGPTYTTATGGNGNLHLRDRDYLIQQNYVAEGLGYCAQTYGLPFWQQNFQSAQSAGFDLGDWSFTNDKGLCSGGQAVVGLSRSVSRTNAHGLLCGGDAHSSEFPRTMACHALDFSNGDSRGTTSTGDWDPGHYKGECAANEFVSGVSQTPTGDLVSILCCPGGVTHSACYPRVFEGSNSMGTPMPDWDYTYAKGSCAPDEYVAGVSRDVSPGGAHAILCCAD